MTTGKNQEIVQILQKEDIWSIATIIHKYTEVLIVRDSWLKAKLKSGMFIYVNATERSNSPYCFIIFSSKYDKEYDDISKKYFYDPADKMWDRNMNIKKFKEAFESYINM